MATFTLAANKAWDDAAFSTRAGKDTYNLYGYTLTVDTDTRYCANATATTGNFGALNINTGKLLVDGTAVRLIPYNSGSGNVPAYGTSISQGGVSGPLLGVWSALNTAPTAAGAAMPASGYIKVRSVTGGAFAAGALTGIGASATGADVAGWIELAGCEGQTITFDSGETGGIGSIVMNGAWFAVGTTPATPATTDTYQLPASEGVAYYAGVEVETGNGTGVYEWWPAVNGLTKNQFATDERGAVCWINSAGVLRFGDDGLGVAVTAWGTATSYAIGDQRENGGTVYFCLVAHTSGTFVTDLAAGRWASGSVGGKLPAANARIRVGNILLSQAASSSPYANVTPNATVATRYRAAGSGITLTMDKVSCGWRMVGGVNGYLLSVANTNILEYFGTSGTLNSIIVDGLCIGQSGAAIAAADSQVNLAGPNSAPIMSNVVVAKKVEATTGAFYLNTVYAGTFSNIKCFNARNRSSGNSYLVYTDTIENVTFNDITMIGGSCVGAGTNCTWNNTKYADSLCGPVQTASGSSVFAAAGYDVVINGVSWVTTTPNTCHPYNAIIALDRKFRTKLRNIGSYASPLNMGTVNQANALILTNGSQLAKIAKIDRCYLTAVRSGLIASGSVANHGVNWQISDCSVSSGAQTVFTAFNGYTRNCMGANSLTYIPGNHVSALYQSATVGTLNFRCSRPLADEPSASTLTASSGVIFTASTAYMPAVDDRVTFKCPFKVRGYTAFSGAPTFSFGTIGNFLVEYSLDLGATWKTASSGNLTGETLPDPAVGFDFWCRATTVTPGNTTANGIGCIVFPMTTSAAAQANQYALEEITFTDSGVLSGSSVAWIDPAGTTVFGFYTGSGGEAIYQNQDGTEKTGSYKVRKAGYAEASGVWVETSSWYLETKTYFVSQALKEATVADSGSITFVGDASATLGASKTFQQLYSNAQHSSCLKVNMLYAIPVISAGGGAYSANVNVVTTGYTLNGAGSLSMGAKTLTATGYTYTGGTFSQLASTPAFSGGTVSIAAEGTYDYTLSSCGVEFGAAGTAWDLSGSTFSGTIALTTSTGALAVTVAVPAGASYTTEGANITVTYPTVARGLDFNTPLPGSTVKVFATGTQTVIATPTGPDWLWSEGVAGSVTVDYTVQKVGYDPIRVTGVTVTAAISGGIQAVAVQQQVARSYVASSGLTFDTNCYADPDTKLFGLANATKSTLQNFYSHMVESWITEPALQNKPFPITPNGPNSFTLGDGWVWDLTTYPNSIANLRGDGQRYVNAFGNVTAIWAAVMSVGVPAGMQVRYQQVDGTGTTNAASTGDMNELVQILSDPNGDGTYTDGYDKRGWLVLKVQEEGYDQSEAVAANGLSTGSIYGTLEDQLYVVGLTPLPNGVAAWGAADDTSITITFEPTPVTWNGQQFSCTIEDTLDGRSGLEIMQIIRARELFNLHDMIRVNGTKFKTVNGNLYGDAYTTPAGVRVVKADGTTAHADFDLFESDTAGSYYTPPVTAPVVWAGAVDGSTVLLYNDSSATPTVPIAAATVTNSSGGYLWNITLPHADVAAGDSLRLRYGHKQYYADELQGTMTSNGLAFVGSMTLHPVYASWGLNGATYDQLYGGPFTMDGLNLQIDIAAGATSGTKVQLGAWTQYLMTLPAGLDAFYGAWDLLAVNQIRQNTTIINVKIDVPVDGALFTFTDNNVNYYRSDFSYPGNVETGHGLIAITYDASPFVATVASSYAITGSIDDVAAKVQIGMTSQGYTTTRAPKLDNLDAAVSTRMAGADFVVPPTPEANAAAVFTQAGLTPMPSDMKKTNDEDIIGDGTPANKFRSHLVP